MSDCEHESMHEFDFTECDYCGTRTYTAKFLGISLRGLKVKLALYRSIGIEVPESSYHGEGA